MTTSFDDEQNQYLELHIELRKGEKESKELINRVTKEVVAWLRQHNAEFRELSDHLKERARPRVHLWPAEHPAHFKPGGKQKWIHK